MASGWTNDDAVQEQIGSAIEDATACARSQLPRGEGLTHYEECDAAIPEVRRRAIPDVHLCVNYQAECNREQTKFSDYDHRGSKGSQLR